MHAIQERPGFYFYTDDAAQLRFSEAHGAAPTTVQAFYIGSSGLQRSGTMPVDLSACSLMAQGIFGEGRPSSGGNKWTGASHRYGIYRVDRAYGDPSVMIFQTHGGGASFYLITELEAFQTWSKLAELPSELLWNLCHSICDTYDKGVSDGKRTAYTQFLEGRLKKRRKQGRVSVEVTRESSAMEVA